MVKEGIEKLRKETVWHFDEYTEGYNDALDDALSVIRSLEEPISDDLEQASYHEVMKLINDNKFPLPTTTIGEQVECFKKFYKTGAEWQKQQMMKDAVECKVKADSDGLYTTETWDEMHDYLHRINAKAGDKVKLIIVKEE